MQNACFFPKLRVGFPLCSSLLPGPADPTMLVRGIGGWSVSWCVYEHWCQNLMFCGVFMNICQASSLLCKSERAA